METRLRSVLKALTWRFGGLLVTVTVAYAITRRAELAASIGLADTIAKLGCYYVHERLWLRIKYGRKAPEYSI